MIQTRLPFSHSWYPLRDISDVSAARRATAALALDIGGGELFTERVRLATTELCTNVLRHGGGNGYLLSRSIGRGMEVTAVDYGGDDVIDLDGLGIGMGIVERATSSFDFYRTKDKGTVMLGRFLLDDALLPPSSFACAGVATSLVPGTPSGDGWFARHDKDRCALLLFDGLGHGPAAAKAATTACIAFQDSYNGDAAAWLSSVHKTLQGTRGGVAGIIDIDVFERTLTFLGAGNISGSVLVDGEWLGVASQNGVVGTENRLPNLRPITFPWSERSMLLLWTDGIKSSITLDGYPHLRKCDPAIIAAVLHRDFKRQSDDASVVVVSHRGQ